VPGDETLLAVMRAIAAGDATHVEALLRGDPALVDAAVETGATREDPQTFFLDEIRHHVYRGDTVLHVAGAAHSAALVRTLAERGGRVGAVNRRGAQPLHYATDGGPGSPNWDPPAQRATVACLLALGADVNATDKQGTTPLLRAIRNRGADAVDALIAGGADVHRTNKAGSSAGQLAEWTTGKSGSGAPEARAEQQRIIELLRAAGVSADESGSRVPR
jgi:ankyrin repeat protein